MEKYSLAKWVKNGISFLTGYALMSAPGNGMQGFIGTTSYRKSEVSGKFTIVDVFSSLQMTWTITVYSL